jgi:hypothetical protein
MVGTNKPVLETIPRNPSVTGKSSETICSFGINLTLIAKGIEEINWLTLLQ